MLINVFAQARFLIWLKQAHKLYNASSFQCTNDKTDIEKTRHNAKTCN